MHDSKSILFITQVYPPDPAAVGQHLSDIASQLVTRGHEVTVLTAATGYDNPDIKYPRREIRDGVRIIRLPWSSFGKRSMIVRLIGGLSFLFQATIRALFTRRLSTVVMTTVPIMSPVCGAILAALRRTSVVFWVMDLNPDQLVALGVTRRDSFLVRALDWFNVALLRRASAVIVLDRFMAERVRAKFDPGERLFIATPWAPDEHLEPVPHDENPFRLAHGLAGKRVVMYSGNHALTNPLTGLLEAARRLKDDDRLVFMFVGGGAGKQQVEALGTPNVRSLPYQPLEEIKYSLSAADVHVVTIGDGVVGIVHPCKIYGAMAVARPILSFGPEQSHVGDIVRNGVGWHLSQADVDGAVETLRTIAAAPAHVLDELGARAAQLLSEEFDGPTLRSRVCAIIEGQPDAI